MIPLLTAASSIATLLLYLSGALDLRRGIQTVLFPCICVLLVFTVWTKRTNRNELYDRILAGAWAGSLATLAYDLVRLPIAIAGVPVFKAISYFGTVILGETTPTILSETVGWSYHFSNGVGFGLMYIFLVSSPRWWTAVLWGLLLEGVMLLTPYAEVFGYRIGSQFLAITIGAHVIYGLALWAALKYWTGGVGFDVKLKKTRRAIWGAFVFSILGIAAIGADFYHRYEGKLAASPPAYIGPHLYVTWDELELDRVASAWVWQRFVEKQARFHFVPVFSRIERGTPFDIPEAKIRRSATRSTTELLVTQQQLEGDLKLVLLARMTHLYEIVPWMATSDPTAVEMARALNMAMGKGKITSAPVAAKLGFAYLDAWYVRLESQKVVPD